MHNIPDPTIGMTEAEEAEYYDRTHDTSRFTETFPFHGSELKGVRYGIDFDWDELELIRARAKELGVDELVHIKRLVMNDARRAAGERAGAA